MRRLVLVFALSAAPAFAAPAERVVTLGGAVTEIVVALGAQDRLVGRDTTSTYPASVMDLPDVGYLRRLSPEGVLSLAPDMILAEADAGPAEVVDVLKNAGLDYLAMPDDPSPEGVIAKIAKVGDALGREGEAHALAATFAADIAALRARTAGIDRPRRVLFVLSLQGGRVMAGGEGSSAEGIIELAGGVNAATGFHGYKPMTDEAVLAAAPEVILMMDREGDMTISDADVLAHPVLGATPAARDGALVRMDGMLLLGFGPRTPEAADRLYRALYPARS